MKQKVMLWAGAGQIGMAIARRVGSGKKIIVSDKGAFITGSTILIDGGATASYFYGPLKPTKLES
jgi:hypothetical protein